ncbi:MAG: non-ribosomal peptide synthetase, partial [Micromonosporaceae bacterium]|nr:non-ribosomal peptide synthetase [Micromonosporaceae bacterium]
MTTSPDVALSETKRALLRRRLSGDPAAVEIPRRPEGVPPPLSYAQERLWFMEQYSPGTGAYALPLALRLHGDLDVARLTRALRQVVSRHETLRTSFPATEDGAPYVQIADPLPVELEQLDLDAGDVPLDQRERRAAELVSESAARPFDLAAGPLLRAGLCRLGAGDHVLLLTAHHAVSDGWSTGILVDELLACYDSADP